MRVTVAAALFAGVSTAQVFSEPPPLIQLVRLPGVNAPALKPYGGTSLDVIGLTTITGLPESWFLEAHGSFASIEDLDQRFPVAPPHEAQTMIAVYREDWSYRPVDASRLFPKTRYFRISIHQVRSGMERDYAQLVQLRRLTEESMGLDRPEMVYQVISGGPVGTYLFIAPFPSLRKLDDGRPGVPVYAERLADARAEAKAKIAPDAEISRDNVFLRVDPSRSYVSDQFAAQDRDFWKGRGQ